MAARGTTVLEVVRDLDARVPGLANRVLDAGPSLRTHLNVYVAGERAAARHAGPGGRRRSTSSRRSPGADRPPLRPAPGPAALSAARRRLARKEVGGLVDRGPLAVGLEVATIVARTCARSRRGGPADRPEPVQLALLDRQPPAGMRRRRAISATRCSRQNGAALRGLRPGASPRPEPTSPSASAASELRDAARRPGRPAAGPPSRHALRRGARPAAWTASSSRRRTPGCRAAGSMRRGSPTGAGPPPRTRRGRAGAEAAGRVEAPAGTRRPGRSRRGSTRGRRLRRGLRSRQSGQPDAAKASARWTSAPVRTGSVCMRPWSPVRTLHALAVGTGAVRDLPAVSARLRSDEDEPLPTQVHLP